MIELTREYGRYGYRQIAALLGDAGWLVNDKRVERLWRHERLKVSVKQPKKGRLWLNNGSFILPGVLAYIRLDNGPEFIAQAGRDWIAAVGAKAAYIEPGSPWENGYSESSNARLRVELLNGEVF